MLETVATNYALQYIQTCFGMFNTNFSNKNPFRHSNNLSCLLQIGTLFEKMFEAITLSRGTKGACLLSTIEVTEADVFCRHYYLQVCQYYCLEKQVESL